MGIVLRADGEAHAYHHGRYLLDLYLLEGLRFWPELVIPRDSLQPS